ncbi:phosphoribosylamine--glycine ligase [Erythrobacter arachoides]|uniref:Phosphoribosylamine--glycine ligase n=1 Tax=Aurantiacibacter arachoides TaxID=1850444 RepID=A0A845A225_9SPHN|nr:phosphoribosylamine--glycine ligase [Aurantiacibacter arachoides]MXO94591.1 phosphoribosylamine--glycine ligase [Aurantiacibacter arachoides]GGD62281.1 phosphoribosylamine--glycine ligase [Aurantiacibacter arachoides]
MNILVLGSGGREHALCWKLAQSASIADAGGTLYAAPGNPGIAACATLTALDAADHAAVVAFCREQAIGLVVIGPEAPLVDGLGDSLRAAGVPVFGPSQAAAQLEGSKAFTKRLCERANIPTARYVEVTNYAQGIAALADFTAPYVIKADGLAAGKGVTIAEYNDAARHALLDIFGDAADTPANAGARAVIEEFMHGEEASFFALTDGKTVVPFGSAQDHKRVGDGDTGPNTGGMGAYSPARVLTDDLAAEAMERIVLPTVRQMAADGIPYSGVLYAGLMLTAEGVKLVEYNARFGDPECQVLMPRFAGDLADVMLACANGTLADLPAPRFCEDTALAVVMAAKGYPGTPEKGGAIDLFGLADDVMVFQAGTALSDGQLVANGGRVLAVTATGSDTKAARDAAYAAIDAIDFPSGFCRRDIGWREIEREQAHVQDGR